MGSIFKVRVSYALDLYILTDRCLTGILNVPIFSDVWLGGSEQEQQELLQEHLYSLSSCTPPYRLSLVDPQLNTFPAAVLFLSHNIWSRMSAVLSM